MLLGSILATGYDWLQAGTFSWKTNPSILGIAAAALELLYSG